MKKFYSPYVFSLLFSIVLLSCSSDDNDLVQSDQFVKANVNGFNFESDQKSSTSIQILKDLRPSGRVNLYVKAMSADGDIMEFLIENFTGEGKYYFGDNYYNNSWIKFQNMAISDFWTLNPRGALNLNTNFIEITYSQSDFIEGKISCRELANDLTGIFGAMEGEFKLNQK